MLLSVVNKVEVARQVRRNRILFWIGVAALVASMITLLISAFSPAVAPDASAEVRKAAADEAAFRSTLVFLLGYPFLIIGLLASKRGAFNNRRHGIGGYQIKNEPDLLSNALEGVPPRYHLYSWIKLGDLPIEHLLVTPLGLMILLVKPQQGDVKASNDRVRRKAGFVGWLATLGEPGIGTASQDLANQVKIIRAWFEKKGYELPVDGVIVFTNARTKILQAEEMSFPVCHIHDLKAAVRGWETELNMTVPEQQEVEDVIIQTLPPEIADEARSLAQMPGYKRAAMLKIKEIATKEKAAKPAKEKAKPEVLPKPKLTPEERERLRLERIKADQEKGRLPVNPMAQQEPGKKVGLDGKVREDKPAIIEKKLPKRRVEPLRRPRPGAFGDSAPTSNGTSSSAKKK